MDLKALLEDKAYSKSPGINFGEEIKTLIYLMSLYFVPLFFLG